MPKIAPKKPEANPAPFDLVRASKGFPSREDFIIESKMNASIEEGGQSPSKLPLDKIEILNSESESPAAKGQLVQRSPHQQYFYMRKVKSNDRIPTYDLTSQSSPQSK